MCDRVVSVLVTNYLWWENVFLRRVILFGDIDEWSIMDALLKVS